jgi:integrase
MRSKVHHNLVPRTLERYREYVGHVLRALQREGRPTHPARWRMGDALRIRELVHGHHWELTVLSDFARAFGNNIIREAGIPSKPSPTHVRWLTRAQVEAIVRETRDDPTLAFVAFLGLGQGLRRVEWQRMRMEDIDLDGRRLLVRGKGRSHPKLQWVPLHPSFPEIYLRFRAHRVHLLEAARTRYPAAPVPAEALIHRSVDGLRSYSLGGLDLMVRRIERRVIRAGVPVRLSSHMFRRSGATLLEEAMLAAPDSSPDGIYRVLQGFLRHENLATTMKYLESNPARQARALIQFAEAVPWSAAEPGPEPVGIVRPGPHGRTTSRMGPAVPALNSRARSRRT